MKHYDKILFVDKSGTTLAPMAEAILQNIYILEDILVESRGLVVLFPEPINPKAEAILISAGLNPETHESRQLTEADFDKRTLIVATNLSAKEHLLRNYTHPVNVYTLLEYIGKGGDLTEPTGGALADYGRCFGELRDYVEYLGEVLRSQENSSQAISPLQSILPERTYWEDAEITDVQNPADPNPAVSFEENTAQANPKSSEKSGSGSTGDEN